LNDWKGIGASRKLLSAGRRICGNVLVINGIWGRKLLEQDYAMRVIPDEGLKRIFGGIDDCSSLLYYSIFIGEKC